MSLSFVRWSRRSLIALAALTLSVLMTQGGTPVWAQYSSTFYYRNPRTGFTYSQGASYGRGYYSGGFSYSTPQQSMSSFSGYGGGRYWSGLSYATPTVPVWQPRRRYGGPSGGMSYAAPVLIPPLPTGTPVGIPPDNPVLPRLPGASVPTAGVTFP
jgi:hypothetical protein